MYNGGGNEIVWGVTRDEILRLMPASPAIKQPSVSNHTAIHVLSHQGHRVYVQCAYICTYIWSRWKRVEW